MTVQAQIEKTEVAAVAASKPAKAPRAPKAPAAKAESKAAPKAKSTASKAKPKAASGINFALMAGVRPNSGANLYAHTQAVVELTGMTKGKGAKKAMLAMVMGETAVRYNMKEGKFELNEKGEVVLTAGGAAQFAARKVEAATVEAFKALLSTGKPNELCKNADFIRKVA
jgi:hypothetical protein